jgi:serine/threonine protein kinase
MKVYEKYRLTDPARRKSVTREIAIMKKMSHPNIVQMSTSFDNPQSIYIIMEHIKGKPLYQYLKEKPYKRMHEDEARVIIKQIAEAMQYVHGQNVAHRDLKLENFIINTKTMKLTMIDFGFSITSGHDKKLKVF